jgi:hypothetical protein
MNDRIIGDILRNIKGKLDEQAHGSMEFPKAEPFEHGVQVGIYSGLLDALSIIDAVLSKDEEAERNS